MGILLFVMVILVPFTQHTTLFRLISLHVIIIIIIISQERAAAVYALLPRRLVVAGK